jgi:hypothetical protein
MAKGSCARLSHTQVIDGPTGTDKERRGAIEERGAMAIRNHALLVVGTGHENFD